MKTIIRGQLNDLRPYGIHMLTGEADNLSYRLLCDVTLEGYKLLCETWGFPYYPPDKVLNRNPPDSVWSPMGWAHNWNSGTDAEPHVASVMLSSDSVAQIAPIALLTIGKVRSVICTTKFFIGLEEGDEYVPAEFDWDKGQYIAPAKFKWSNMDELHDWDNDLYGRLERFIGSSSHPSQGTRNTHQMTGRSL